MRSLKVKGEDGTEIVTLDMRARKRLVQLWNTQIWNKEEKRIDEELANPDSKAARLFKIMRKGALA